MWQPDHFYFTLLEFGDSQITYTLLYLESAKPTYFYFTLLKQSWKYLLLLDSTWVLQLYNLLYFFSQLYLFDALVPRIPFLVAQRLTEVFWMRNGLMSIDALKLVVCKCYCMVRVTIYLIQHDDFSRESPVKSQEK